MNEIIKSKIKRKNLLFKQYIQNGRFETDFVFLENLITEINELISSTKNLHYETSLIPPLLVDNKFVTDIQIKANIFNNFFAEQCTPLKNSSALPLNQMFLTQSRFNCIDFNGDEILKIVRALNIHKTHGHDDASIRMIKICDKSLVKPLILLFENSAKSSSYSDIWKKSNIIPVHKKNDKRLVNNYRPISLAYFWKNIRKNYL